MPPSRERPAYDADLRRRSDEVFAGHLDLARELLDGESGHSGP